ncbi:hypothetical protein L1987_70575 [Smallanthus sonchifolius]|uniref:Uncharacterized protein n=1 Tax=Smallanthus sonchifolius TaxID=185202 RepID=A0ACB9APY8_9ASTR|nr:hypothetical protein L1987_70575 [Smallanthus sonchifolius]
MEILDYLLLDCYHSDCSAYISIAHSVKYATALHTNISVWINRRFVSSISSDSTKVASIVGKQREGILGV